ncbi:hypothetical protein NpNSSI1_00010183 [Neofusicoccum parvum]|uniref:Uncharacterized protein n=1 Tax=Neofusicoccum parvum TaxID=310453 RepID=A0ACB5RVV9_9PEZI|nr:hypothetical protein NpPPO83_00006910 [Neofusicoccum parvum]GME51816.1 hypothetical protein NpNSSI1_00010183 [Neofusicoccum parvum]
MLASTLILTVLAGKALVEAAPAPEYTSYPETITIHPPKTRKIWPVGWRFKPTHTDNLLTFAARETAGSGSKMRV